MVSIKVGGGLLMIDEETIQIELGPIRALKRLYEQSKLIIIIVIVGLPYTAGVAVFGSSPLREFGQFAILFIVIGFPVATIHYRLSNSIRTASEIRRSAIDHIEYTTGSQLRFPTLRIIITNGEVTEVRPVTLLHQRLGGDQQLEDAIQAFEESGITIDPADGAIDQDR